MKSPTVAQLPAAAGATSSDERRGPRVQAHWNRRSLEGRVRIELVGAVTLGVGGWIVERTTGSGFGCAGRGL